MLWVVLINAFLCNLYTGYVHLYRTKHMFHKWLVQKLFQLKKKGRKPNYSTQENLFLAERYEEYKDILDSPHKDVNTNSKKRKAWNGICSQHAGRFLHVARTLSDLKLKLSKLKMDSRQKLQEQKKSRNKTGGGKPTSDPTPAQQKILDLCEDTPGFKGLHGVETPATACGSQDHLSSDAGTKSSTF